MARGRYAKWTLAGSLALALFVCSSCVVIHAGEWNGARYETEVELTAPLTPGSSFAAETRDGSIHTNLPITIEGKVGKSLTGRRGSGEGKVHLRTGDGSITIR